MPWQRWILSSVFAMEADGTYWNRTGNAVNLIVIIAALPVGWLGTVWLERLAPRLGLVQVPNERSSHTRPTPRGGGLAIALAIVIALGVLAAGAGQQVALVATLTAIIAALGFTDDLRDISPLFRFAIQILVIAALISTFWPLPDIALVAGVSISGVVLAILVGLVGLWWLNLFNFMDGIDGIAGSQAVLLLLGGLGLWALGEPGAVQSPLFVASLAAVLATVGFLIRNWPPARIFMGDAGSNSLALFILALALATIASSAVTYQSWLILPAAFVTDSTVTLVRRMLRRQLPWRAHRQHVYQIFSRAWGHMRTTLGYAGLTALWTIPLALCAQAWPELSWWFVIAAYLPLVAGALMIGPDER